MGNIAEAADLIAIDVGNSRIKFGQFCAQDDCQTESKSAFPIAPAPLPEPDETLSASIEQVEHGMLNDWLDQIAMERARIVVGSVSKTMADRLTPCLMPWFTESGIPFKIDSLRSEKMPIPMHVENPASVGVDRLAAALAADRLRQPGAPAIIVDVGTAVTIDLVSSDGVFEGGAILPGVQMAARAMHEQTDALPKGELTELEDAPDAIGKNTLSAIHAGLFWGAVGAIRELIDRQRDSLTHTPQVFLSGGAAPSVARLIGGPDYTVRHVAHLTLAGLVIAARVMEPSS